MDSGGRRPVVSRALVIGLATAAAALLSAAAGLVDLSVVQRAVLFVLTAVVAGSAAAVEAMGRRGHREIENARRRDPSWRDQLIFSNLFQLPRNLKDFTGREQEVQAAFDFVVRNLSNVSVPVTVVAGKGGVGKTAFVTHVAHRLRDRFPDGQLYVDLRGASGAVDVREVLAGLLRELGVARAAVPEGLDERARLYRARMSGRRILIVLDDAADETQVRPLLPGGPGCAVFVTRRMPLVGIADALRIRLEELAPGQAIDFLQKVVGPERVNREPDAAAEVMRLCGFLPLAVRIVGNKIASKQHWTMQSLAERLRDHTRRLVELSAGDLEVRASIALSYDGLVPTEQRLFRLLSLLEVQDFPAWAAAAVGATDMHTAESLVERLVDAQLLVADPAPSTGAGRYEFHTLLQVFAWERLQREESPQARREALRLALEAYIAVATRAYQLAERSDVEIGTQPASRWNANPRQLDWLIGNVTAWFAAERANLVALAEQADRESFYEEVCRLSIALYGSFNVGAHWHAWQRLYQRALAAARQCADPRFEAEILRLLGDVYKNSGRVDGPGGIPEPDREDMIAADWLEQSRAAFQRLGDDRAEVAVIRRLAGVYRDLGYIDPAEECYRDGLALARSIPNSELLQAYLMRGYGCLYRMTERHAEAVNAFDASLAIFDKAVDHRGKLGALRGLGETYRLLGRWREAEDCFQAHLEMDRDVGDRHAEAHMICGLGQIRLGQGHLQEAVAHFAECLPMFQEIGHRSTEAETLECLGEAMLGLGRRREALAAWARAHELYLMLSLPQQVERMAERVTAARGIAPLFLLVRRVRAAIRTPRPSAPNRIAGRPHGR